MKEVNLPDFDEMYETIVHIRNLAVDVAKLELKIKVLEGEVFVRGREEGLAVNLVTNAYKTSGWDNEILPLRVELTEKQAELRFLENTLNLYRSKIDVWRSVSANERTGIAWEDFI